MPFASQMRTLGLEFHRMGNERARIKGQADFEWRYGTGIALRNVGHAALCPTYKRFNLWCCGHDGGVGGRREENDAQRVVTFPFFASYFSPFSAW